MQAVIVHPAADYAAGSPSLSFPVPQADGAPSAPKAPAEDGSRKSFDEMIHEARAESRAPSERQEAGQPPEAASHELSEQPVQLAERQLEARVPAEGGGGVPHDAEAGKLQAAPVPNRFQRAGRTASEKSDGRSDAARKGRGAAPKRTQDDGLDAPLAFAALDGLDAGAALSEGEDMEAAAALFVPIAAAEALPSSFAALPADEKDMRAGAADADIDERPRARRLAFDSEGKIVVTDLRTERHSMQAAAGMPQEGSSARVID
ncbi:MAG: hypothetical protein K2H09_00585, partial [Treponemataceae bacterium]|nr:hypothetical protein [Treponemataceae bacterium]